jgi:hypothetical protein
MGMQNAIQKTGDRVELEGCKRPDQAECLQDL